MKIVLFTHPNFFNSQSMPRYANFIYKEMGKRGHEINIWTPKAFFYNFSKHKTFQKWLGYIDQYLLFPVVVRKRIKTCTNDTLFVFADQALGPWVPLVKNKPHVVHCHDFMALRSAIDKVSGQKSVVTPAEVQRVNDATGKPIYTLTNKKGTRNNVADNNSNYAFDLTAAEKVALDKTKFYIAEVSPGFEKLSDKAIVDRMMDRKWVEGAVAKARDQARAFEEIAQRAKTDADIRAAQASREKMLDVADMMEENLRAPRADASRKQQGPKTRAEIRNNMITNRTNRNALRED